jgi:hypothetical protein
MAILIIVWRAGTALGRRNGGGDNGVTNPPGQTYQPYLV